jgi:hypothetical protein
VRRRLFSIASVLSLPLCVATLLLCLASTLHQWRWSETLDYYASRDDGPDLEVHHCVGLSNGVLYAQSVHRGRLIPVFPVKAVHPGYPVAYPIARTILGFNLWREKAVGWSFREWDFPLWPIAVATAILPLRSYARRRRALRAGLCATCNYNLTGNVSGVCPECGTIVVPRADSPG